MKYEKIIYVGVGITLTLIILYLSNLSGLVYFNTDRVLNGSKIEGITYETVNQINKIGDPIHIDDSQEIYNHMYSAGVMHDCNLTDNGDGTINITSGYATLRSTNDSHATLYSVEVNAQSNIVLTDNKTNYVYLDWNTGSPTFNVGLDINDFNCQDKCVGYIVSREGNHLEFLDVREQNVDSNRKLRRKELETGGFEHVLGGSIITGTGLNISLTAGEFYYELTKTQHSAFDTSLGDIFHYYYTEDNGVSWLQTDVSSMDNLQYNDAGVGLVTLANNKYKVDWVYVINDGPSHLAVLYGQEEYAKLADATAAGIPALAPASISGLGALVGRVIIEKGAVTMITESAFERTFSATTPTTHNGLAGIQGGTVNSYYHLPEVYYTELTNWLNNVILSPDGSIYSSGNITANNFIGYHEGNNSLWSKTNGDVHPTDLTANVGIGTATPKVNLEIYNGSILLDDPTTSPNSNKNFTLQSHGQTSPALMYCGFDSVEDQCVGYHFDSGNKRVTTVGTFATAYPHGQPSASGLMFGGTFGQSISSPVSNTMVIEGSNYVNITNNDIVAMSINGNDVLIPNRDVGIGTPTPEQVLDVVGSIKIGNARSGGGPRFAGFYGETKDDVQDLGIFLYSSDGTSNTLFFGSNGGSEYAATEIFFDTAPNDSTAGSSATRMLNMGGGSLVEFNPSEVDMDFVVNADGISNALFVQGSDGFIGLKTNAPEEAIDLRNQNGAIIVGSTVDQTQNAIRFLVRPYNAADVHMQAFRARTGVAGGFFNSLEFGGGASDSTAATSLSFFTTDNISTQGVGTLMMSMAFAASTTMNPAFNDVNFIINDDTGVLAHFDAGLGRVGIGTSTPSATLDVVGNATMDRLAIGSNGFGGLSPGDINASTIYYDTLTAKSPVIMCSDDWCSVSLPKYQKTYYLQKDDYWNVLNLKNSDGADIDISSIPISIKKKVQAKLGKLKQKKLDYDSWNINKASCEDELNSYPSFAEYREGNQDCYVDSKKVKNYNYTVWESNRLGCEDDRHVYPEFEKYLLGNQSCIETISLQDYNKNLCEENSWKIYVNNTCYTIPLLECRDNQPFKTWNSLNSSCDDDSVKICESNKYYEWDLTSQNCTLNEGRECEAQRGMIWTGTVCEYMDMVNV